MTVESQMRDIRNRPRVGLVELQCVYAGTNMERWQAGAYRPMHSTHGDVDRWFAVGEGPDPERALAALADDVERQDGRP